MNKWDITKSQQKKCMDMIMPELSSLRAKAGISQGDLAKLIGISRQTYSSVESGNREMTWSTYLLLLQFYDYNISTHYMLRNLGVFPDELVSIYNGGSDVPLARSQGIAGVPDSIIEKLDDTAFQAIRTAIMLEYARCTKQSAEAVIKAFDGIDFTRESVNPQASMALRSIRKAKRSRKTEQ